MSEKETLDSIFDINPLYKNKYKLIWCDLCSVYSLICPDCDNSTCNGGGCEKCKDDFTYFIKTVKRRINQYLTAEEEEIYNKISHIKNFMRQSILNGEEQINFKELKENGNMSEYVAELFTKELK